MNKSSPIELRPQQSMPLQQASHPRRDDWKDALCRVCYRSRFVGGSSSSRVGAGWVARELELPPTRTNLLSISPVLHYSNTPQFHVSL